MQLAKNTCGKLVFPMGEANESTDISSLCKSAGADVLTQTPEIANWLVETCPTAAIHIGCYIYLDGQDFVRAAVAMDAIVQAVSARRTSSTGIAFLETPSHCHVVPQQCEFFSKKYAREAPWWQSLLKLVGILKPLKFKALECDFKVEGKPACVLNALVGVQGPNYAMAKLIQRWRICAHKLGGQSVSVNVAPPAATNSVMHVKKVAFALKNVHHFRPNILFKPETVRLIMALLLVKDVQDAKSLSNPNVKAHPLALVADQAWHGGNWTCAYSGDSAGVGAYIVGLIKKNAVILVAVLLLLIALVAYYVM